MSFPIRRFLCVSVSICFIVVVVLLVFRGSEASADTLYASTSTGEIITVTPGGKVSTFAKVKAPGVLWGVAFDGSGNLFVGRDAGSGSSGGISRITPSGLVTPFFSGASVEGLAFDSSGNLYASSPGSIRRFGPDGANTIIANGSFGEGSFGAGLAFDRYGDLFAADREGKAVLKVGPDGTTTVFAKLPGAPIGLAFDTSDNLYVSTTANAINKVSPDVRVTTFATGLHQPWGLAFDSHGNLYAADEDNISAITPSGVVSTFVVPSPTANFIAIQVPEPGALGPLAVAGLILTRRKRTR